MQKYINRRLSFSAAEIKEALIQRLSDRDIPYPTPSAQEVKFELTATGALLAWTEDTEQNF